MNSVVARLSSDCDLFTPAVRSVTARTLRSAGVVADGHWPEFAACTAFFIGRAILVSRLGVAVRADGFARSGPSGHGLDGAAAGALFISRSVPIPDFSIAALAHDVGGFGVVRWEPAFMADAADS